jgi:hypothetical protein
MNAWHDSGPSPALASLGLTGGSDTVMSAVNARGGTGVQDAEVEGAGMGATSADAMGVPHVDRG